MSTSILTLSENGELQKLHDMWLTRSAACSSEAKTEIEANQLHFDSFKGLFLICGLACVLSLVVYLCIMIRQYIRRVLPNVQDPSGQESAWSQCCPTNLFRLKSFFSFVDEREQDARKRSVKQQEEPSNGIVAFES
jgi:glutamate receptor, ionotropic, plant